MQYYLYILAIPFLYLNYKILTSDIKYKKIPNKTLLFLLLLVPFFYVYLFSINGDINILLFLVKIFVTIIISFILYFYGIWSAGDAKYLLVLSLFIPHIGVIPFIGNIALITLFYLILYFFYFYLIKVGGNKIYRKSLFENIKITNKEKINVFLKNGTDGNLERKIIIYKFLKAILLFLTIFVIIRLTRLYIFEDLKHLLIGGEVNNGETKNFVSKYSSYIIGGSTILTFALFYFFRKIYKFFFLFFKKHIFEKKLVKITSGKDLGFYFLLIVFFLLISFIFYEYLKNGNEVLEKLYLIFTLYLGLYLLFKILFFSYKITFQLAEQDYINIKILNSGEIIDKDFLIKLFGKQECLGASGENQNKKGLFYPDPIKYIQNIDNPIDEETKNIIKKSYNIVNKHHIKNKTIGYEKRDDIKVLKTFPFALYIIIGFIITFFIQDKIFKYFIDFGYRIVKNIYN